MSKSDKECLLNLAGNISEEFNNEFFIALAQNTPKARRLLKKDGELLDKSWPALR